MRFFSNPRNFTEKELDEKTIACNNDKQKCECFMKKISINEYYYIQQIESKPKFNVKQYLYR